MSSALELLQRLIRIDTTNPPGNESAAVELIQQILGEAGFESKILAKDPSRPNLIARLSGRGDAPPFLMQGHVDVVPTTGQQWAHDPFAAEVIDGWVWGRGALDMKSGVVMMLEAFLRLGAEPELPAGDVILCVLSDEEAGGMFGARFLVEEHAELFAGVRYCIGEFGGFPFEVGGRRFYPVQVAERVPIRFELTFRGPAGHGSLPLTGGAMAKLGRALVRLDRRRMPVHIVPATRMMLESMIEHTEGSIQLALKGLLEPKTAGAVLRLLSSQLSVMEAVLRNTVNATIVSGGDKDNVVAAETKLVLDGRMLPGFELEGFARELEELVGDDVEIAYRSEGLPSGGDPDMGLFPLLSDLLKELDPDAIPVPFLLPAVTDGRWFAQLGIQHYGFLPMNLPADFVFTSTLHAADERIPVGAVDQGAETIYQLLRRYPG